MKLSDPSIHQGKTPDQPASSCTTDAPGRDSLGVTVIVPAYNEERGLPVVLEQLIAFKLAADSPVEILVVDDGSEDNTAEVIGRYQAVTLLRHATNRGYGASLKTAIRRASHEIVCITDADGTYPNEMIPVLVTLLGPHDDMVVGSRTGEEVAIPYVRRPAKWFIGRLANVVAGEEIPDVNSGLRAFRRSVALRFLPLLPDGFSFTTTITLAMLANGYHVVYTPINYHARVGSSKIRPIRDTLHFVQLILRIGLYFAPLTVFLPLSALCLITALAWALFSTFILGQLADVSTLILTMTAFQVAVIGLIAELISKRLPYYWKDQNRM